MNAPASFNLAQDPWIPVRFLDGTSDLVSLREAFARGRAIHDLAARPHERIALLRLLICIAQAALNGPDTDDAGEWREAEEGLPDAASKYLEKWAGAFALFGEGPRFLQLRTAKAEETAASKLFPPLASGNNPTLFDHAGGEERAFAPAALALGLVSFQNFSPLIGRGYTGRGPCVDRNALHVFRIGANLLETVLLNGVSIERIEGDGRGSFGRPIWEMPLTDPAGVDSAAVRNATRTYLGRLAPLARSVWLAEDGRSLVLANGPDYPAFKVGWKEPSATEGIRQEKERYLLGASLGRAVWRELHAITVANSDGLGRAATLARQGEEEACSLWAGGMVTDFKAKIEDAVASRFQGDLAVPGKLFSSDTSAHLHYHGGVQAANAWENAARFAVKQYADILSSRNSDKPTTDQRTTGLRDAASAFFWNEAEQHLRELFALVNDLTLLGGKAARDPYAPTAWHRALRRAAAAAFEAVCPQDNARQHEAAGKARAFLRAKSLESKPARRGGRSRAAKTTPDPTPLPHA
ncbi:MAG: type I-E CRISPR-associated protein Cse1/CasA [Verrucomicrobiales bacterium]